MISIIMPVYNTEKYLSEAIESVLNQTHINWELICVDDGSTDNSLKILEEYSKIDIRINVIKGSHSGTASAARNKALPFVKGDYIAMLDSDDKYDNNTLKLLFDTIQMFDPDFIVFNAIIFEDFSNRLINLVKGIDNKVSKVISGKEAFIKSLNWSIIGIGVVRSNIVKKVKYCEEGMNGDELSTRLFFLESKKVTHTVAKYFYRNHQNSTVRKVSEKYFYVLDTEFSLLKIIINGDFDLNLKRRATKKYFKSIFDLKVRYLKNKKKLDTDSSLRVESYILKHLSYSRTYNLRMCKNAYNHLYTFLFSIMLQRSRILFDFSALVKSKIK